MISKKKIWVLGLVGVVLIIIAGIIINLLVGKVKPPVIRFIDDVNNIPLFGEVYLNGEYMGMVEEGMFDGMPESYCYGKHTITLKSLEYELQWESLPSDCDSNTVVLNYGEAVE
tara:strand:- start:823 stop:1164 length:342 start_codon:yes stop_codon:yes gene_type:complete